MTAPAKAAPRRNKQGAKQAAAEVTSIDGGQVDGPKYTRKAYPKPKEGFKLYEAGPGGAGYINVRAHDKVMVCAAEISDPKAEAEGGRNPNWILGLISRFFDSDEKFDRYKKDREELGYVVKKHDVREYSGPVSD